MIPKTISQKESLFFFIMKQLFSMTSFMKKIVQQYCVHKIYGYIQYDINPKHHFVDQGPRKEKVAAHTSFSTKSGCENT